MSSLFGVGRLVAAEVSRGVDGSVPIRRVVAITMGDIFAPRQALRRALHCKQCSAERNNRGRFDPGISGGWSEGGRA